MQESVRISPGVRRPYARLLRYVAVERRTLLAALVASGISAGAVAAYAWLLGPLFRALLTGAAVRLGPWTFEGKDLLWRIPTFLVGVAAIKASAQMLHNGWMQSVSQRVLQALREDLYARLLRLPPRYFDTRHSGEILSRFTSDIAQVEFSVAQALSSYVKDSLIVLALLVQCWLVDTRLFVLAFIVLPAAGIPVSRFAKSVKRQTTRSQGSLAALTELVAEHLQNLPVVQAFQGEARGTARFREEENRYFQAMKRSLFLRGAFTPTLEVMGIVGVAAVIGYGARAVQAEPDLAVKLPSFLAAALLMYQPLKALSGTFGLTMQGLSSAARLFEVTDHPPEPDTGAPAGPLRNAVTLENVRFSYDGERPVLNDVTLAIPKGKKIALVGPSGSGKSTLFALLLRQRTPTSGRVIWDGVDAGALAPSSMRAQMAWVPQEPVLFSGSVRDNLYVGMPGASDDALWEALSRAHALDFVKALENGLDATIGEGGRQLSGGQRQRLSIARAFLRAPSLLLLDEPTSALDTASEAEVQAGLAELMRDRTTLVIAHRLSTVKEADWLYVMDEGRIVEEGTHGSLLEQGGIYSRMVQSLDSR
jgi:ATP-binding cassette, subfamily B, bacterial MsbA